MEKAKKEMADLLADSSFCQLILEKVNDGIAVLENGFYIYVNDNFLKIFGYESKKEIIGRHISLTVHKGDFKKIKKMHFLRQKGKEISSNFRFRGLKKNGQIIFLESSSFPVFYKGKIYSVAFIKDINHQVELENEFRKLSLLDELTGLYNRRGFSFLATQHMKLADRLKKRLFLLFIDLNEMKKINDDFGHEEGDNALRAVAGILKKTFRKTDLIARYGGDEFVVMAVETSSVNKEYFCWRLKEELGKYNAHSDKKYLLSLSIGISCYDFQNPVSLQSLIMEADFQMYQEKKEKANRV